VANTPARKGVSQLRSSFRRIGLTALSLSVRARRPWSAAQHFAAGRSAPWHAHCFGLWEAAQPWPAPASTGAKGESMLWTIFVILLVLWLLGMVSSYTMGGFIHLLLVLAIVVVLIRVIQGRNPV
jgi:hypothetical protein